MVDGRIEARDMLGECGFKTATLITCAKGFQEAAVVRAANPGRACVVHAHSTALSGRMASMVKYVPDRAPRGNRKMCCLASGDLHAG